MLSLIYNENDKSSVLALAKKLIGKRLSEVLDLKFVDEINNLKGNKEVWSNYRKIYLWEKS